GKSHGRLCHRPKPGHDHATPSGNAVAAWALVRLAAMTGDERYARAARRTLALFYPAMREYAAGYAAMSIALAEQLVPPKMLVLRGRGAELESWREEFAREYLHDGLVVAVPVGAAVPAHLTTPKRTD